MSDVLFTLLVVMLGIMVHTALLRRNTDSERRLMNFSFGAHLLSGVAQILLYVYYYGGGDMTAYYEFGVPIAQLLRHDFATFFPETVSAFLHQPFELPFFLLGEGSTGSMSVVAVWLLFLFGDSFWASAIFVSIMSCFAKFSIYEFLKLEFPQHALRPVLIGATLAPSAVFWTSALLKEPIALCGFGPFFVGLRWLAQGRNHVSAITFIGLGSVLVWSVKPYVLVALLTSSVLFFVWRRLARRGQFQIRPTYLALGFGTLVVGFVLANRFLGVRENTSVLSSMAYQRRVSAMESGGSNFTFDEENADDITASEVSLGSQLLLVPVALGTAFYRPFIFEVRSPVQALNGFETLWLSILTIQLLRSRGLGSLLRSILSSPTLLFCLIFSLILAVGTGLSTANLGTLSRYRAPMIPFFVTLLLSLKHQRDTASAVSQEAAYASSSVS
jgi:hypothetical protein